MGNISRSCFTNQHFPKSNKNEDHERVREDSVSFRHTGMALPKEQCAEWWGLDEECWADSMEYYCYLRNVTDLLSDEKTPCERRFGMPSNEPVVPFGAMVEYHPISAGRTDRDHTNLFHKSCPVYSLDVHLTQRRIWKGDILVADIEELEQMDASEIYVRRLNAKEVSTPMKNEKMFIPSRRWNRPNIWRSTSKDIHLNPGSSRTRRGQVLRGGSDVFSSPTPLQDDSALDDAEARNDFWSTSGDSIYRHHVEPRVKLYMPRKESFLIPMKYIDVSRLTHASLEIESCRMHRFHQIHFIECKATWRMCMVQGDTDEETNNFKTRQNIARFVEAFIWCIETHSKAKMDHRETNAR